MINSHIDNSNNNNKNNNNSSIMHPSSSSSTSSSSIPPPVPPKEFLLTKSRLLPTSPSTTTTATSTPIIQQQPKRRLPRFWQQSSSPPKHQESFDIQQDTITATEQQQSASSLSSSPSSNSNGFGIRSFKRNTDDKPHTPKRSISLRRRRPSVTPTEQVPSSPINTINEHPQHPRNTTTTTLNNNINSNYSNNNVNQSNSNNNNNSNNNMKDISTTNGKSPSSSSLLTKTLPIAPPLLRRGSTPWSTHSASSTSSGMESSSSASTSKNILLLERWIAHKQQQQPDYVVTVHECCTWIGGYCNKLDINSDHVWKKIDAILESIEYILVQTNAFKGLFRRRIMELQQQSQQAHHVSQVLRDIEKICNAITTSLCCTSDHKNLVTTTAQQDQPQQLPLFKHEISHHLFTTKKSPLQPDYAKMWPDHMDRSFSWFRQHFVGKPYTTLVRTTDDETIIISVVKDYQSEACRVIIRSNNKKYAGHYFVDSEHLKVVAGDHDLLYHRHAIAAIYPELDLNSFKELSAEASILAGLEKELLRFDELVVPKHYKFGVLNVKENQTNEEEWFSNTGMSPGFQRFLDLVGQRVELKGYTGYAAGLDTKSGETGEFSYISRWHSHEIMFHVAALMPWREHDRQQVHRKRHIGNDIICLVFVEGNGKFDPNAIRSQFLHVFVVVHLDHDSEGNEQWRMEIVRNPNVDSFGPTIPAATQLSTFQLRDFLLLKMVNGENAALKSDKFSIPNNKARAGMLRNMATSVDSVQTARNNGPPKNERPRSTGAHNSSFAKRAGNPWRSRPSLDVPGSPPPLPPMPVPSRSNMLRDLTAGFTRRGRRTSGNKDEESKVQEQQQNESSSSSTSRFMKPPSLVSNVMRGRSISSTNVRAEEMRTSQSSITRSNTFSRRIGRSSLNKSN